MQHCAEERRKLAAEWSRFHTQEKLRQERVEREASRAMERDANREGSIFSMAQVNTDPSTGQHMHRAVTANINHDEQC